MASLLEPWERARRGQHTIVVGLPLAPAPQDLRVVRVSCDVPQSTSGPLLEARARIERILGTHAPFVEMARSRVMTGLRRHLLGDLPSVASEGSLVDVCNRLAALGPAVLVLEAADAADPASLDMLRHLLGRPGWLRLPVLLVMRAARPSDAARALVAAVRETCGADAIVGSPPDVDLAASSGPAPSSNVPPETSVGAPTSGKPSSGAPASFDPRGLPAEVLRVLRALAIAGSGCEAQVLAAALDSSEMAVLDALQRAADAGAPIEDRGEGRFHLPESLIATLRRSILPSLAAAWHRRVADILGPERASAGQADIPPLPTLPFPAAGADDTPRPGDAWEVMQAEAPPTMRLPKTPEIEPESPRAAAQAISQAAARVEREAEAEAARASAEASEHTEEAEGVRRMGAESPMHADDDAADRAAEEAAERAAEEAAAHASEEARLAAEAAALKAAADRRAADKLAAHAVETAQRELADDRTKTSRPGRATGPDDGAPAHYQPFTGEARSPSAAQPAKWISPMATEPRARIESVPQPPNDARAARHLAAAGDTDAAIDRYFQAMQRAAAAAAYPQAVAHAEAALALLDRLAPTAAHRQKRVQLLLEAGRVLWHGAGPAETFTLSGALRVLESARAALDPSDPVELVAEVSITIAGVLYDIGDLASLTRALDELATASRALANAGQPQAAARLFNDQASVYIRLGDPVRAAHLLTESRSIFEGAAKTDPIAMVEMAETDHLFAKILLHVPARPGREDDALSLGLDHALAAERAFRRLDAPREVGRVLETMGRIELRKGRLPRAAEHLTTAARMQESIGDLIGLAQSTAALAEVLAAGGQPRETLNLLANSMVLNFEKGSPLGLALNRKALASLAESSAVRAQAGDLLDTLSARLARMEQHIGRAAIPGAAEATTAVAGP